ncbi:MAG: UPF0489 family protein [Candidatus Margulisiibacteriota bacterium]
MLNLNKIKLLTNSDRPIESYGKYCICFYKGNKVGTKKLGLESRLTTPPIFISANHGEAYGFWWFAYYKGLLKKESLLLHFDAHHDLNPATKPDSYPKNDLQALKTNEGCANFIVPAFYHKLIASYHWVLPLPVTNKNIDDYFKKYCPTNLPQSRLVRIHSFRMLGVEMENDQVGLANEGKIIGRSRWESHKHTPCYLQPKITITTFEKLTLSLLPEQDLILDLDLDWFGDKDDDIPSFFHPRLDFALQLFLKKIKDLNLKPAVITIALSPRYATRLKEINNHFPKLIKGLLS